MIELIITRLAESCRRPAGKYTWCLVSKSRTLVGKKFRRISSMRSAYVPCYLLCVCVRVYVCTYGASHVCLSTRLLSCIFVCLPARLPNLLDWFACLRFAYPAVTRVVFLCLNVCLPVCLFVRVHVCLSACLTLVCLSVCLFVCLIV